MGKVEKESKSKLRFSFWASIQKLLVNYWQIVSFMRLAVFCYDVEQFHKGFISQRKYTIGVNYLSALFGY